MTQRLARFQHELQAGHLVSIDVGAGARLFMRRGHAWMTVEGYSQDKWLTRGEDFVVAGPARVVIEATEPSSLEVEDTQQPALKSAAAAVTEKSGRWLRALARVSLRSPAHGKCRAA